MNTKLIKSVLTIVLCLSTMVSYGQTVITIINDSDSSLAVAVDNANPGDILELTVDGVYLSKDPIVLDQDITIRGAAGLANRPVIKYVGTSTSAYMFKGIGSPRIALEYLEFDGDGTTEGAAALAKYVVRLDNGDPSGTMSLFMNDCVAHDFNDKFIKPYGNCGMDSLVVTNSIFYNGAKEGIVFYSGSSSDPAAQIAYGEVSNSTFYNMVRECIKGDTYTDGEILVDRITAYNCGGASKGLIYFDDWLNVTVKNSIFALNNYASYSARFESAANLFTNNVIWDVLAWDVDNATVVDTLHVDPGFANPGSGDFSIPTGSVLLTHATDGGAVGDPRWVPDTQTIWEVAAGTDVIETALAAASSGDIIELTTSGGSYLNSNQLVVDMDITIRGRSTLPEKPVIKYIGTSTSAYMFKGIGSPRIALEYLEFDGDGTTEGAAALAKYVVRLDNGDPSGTMSLFMNDCVAHDFNDKFIKPYGNCGMDSLVVTNSIFYNGAKEGIVFYSGSSSDPAAPIAYGEVSNSTFYNMVRECIKGDTYTDGEILVDRITAYNCGGTSKGLIYFDDWLNVTVKNSIFALNNYASYSARFESAANLFTNNVIWDVLAWDVDNATVVDTLHVDPGFASPGSGDFSIPTGSVLLTHATDGGAVGDPRWYPPDGWYSLNVYIVGEGSVVKDPDSTVYAENTVVTLTATPDQYWAFDQWSDNIVVFPPNNPVATVTMTDNMLVTAYFVPTINEFTVDTSSIGLGHINLVKYSDFNLDGFYEGDSLVLTPIADTTTWEFAYWVDTLGDSLTNVVPLTYVVNADTAFTALFRSTITQYALNLTVTGMGDVDIDPLPVPGFDTYDSGTEITLIADVELGWDFDGYSGDVVATTDTVVFTLDADKTVTATFTEIVHPDGILAIDDTWEILDAVEYAHNNSQVHTIKLTTIGPYEPDESLRDPSNGRMPPIEIESPIAIVGDESLGSKPVVRGYTSSTSSTSSEGFFRFRAGSGKLVLKYLSIDGYLDEATDAKSAKYIFRADDGSDTVFCSLDAENVDFKNTVEAFWKNYGLAHVDTMRFVNCNISNIGKEALYLKAVGNVNHLELKNNTFSHVNRQIVYLMNMAPTIVVDHVTIDSCGLGYGTEGAKFPAFRMENCEDILITNTIISNVPFTDVDYTPYAVRISGENSMIDNCLFHNAPTKIDLKDGAQMGDDLYWYDPLFIGPDSGNYTLADSSVAYHLAGDGSAAIGDLIWATSTNVATYYALNLTVGDHGEISQNPEPMAKFHIPATVVTLTAEADSGYVFVEWTGDLTGNDNPTTITMDEDKNVTAVFEEEVVGINKEHIPKEYSLLQNYPNPFNPTTTINFALKNPGYTSLKVYNILGKQVATLVDQNMEAGNYRITFHDRNLASGIYFYMIESGDFVAVRKMIMIK